MNVTDDAHAVRELRAAAASGNPQSIARAAMANIWPLYCAHFDELIAAVEGLPASLLERFPVLRILHRMTPVLARTTRPFKPLVYPEDARAMSPDELDILTLVQMIAFRFSGDVAAALIYARRLEDRILQIRTESRERTDGPLWFYHQQIGSTLLAAGDSSRALLAFATARQLGRLSPQPDAERMALGRTALAHAVRGSLDDADLTLDEIGRHPQATDAHIISTTTTERTARALIAVEKMAPDAETLIESLEPYDSIQLTWPFAVLARTRALLAHHRPDEALEVIRLASEAHPDQHGSFASDVIHSMSIAALWAVGSLGAARKTAESTARTGLLTRLAIARHALLESRLDVAEQVIRSLSAEHSVGPGPRAELTLLTAWLECVRADSVAAETARQVARLAQKRSLRRVMSTMPLQLIDRVRENLPQADADALMAATAGLTPVEVAPRPVLTSSELRVLAALASRATTSTIAAQLHVSPNTIKSQLSSVYRKLDCSTRDDAVRIAARLNLLVSEGE